MTPRHPNQDVERPVADKPRKRGVEPVDRTHREPGDLADRAADAGMDVDDQDQGGDQDIDTAGIPDVDPDAKNARR
jgi:hypothetical protein